MSTSRNDGGQVKHIVIFLGVVSPLGLDRNLKAPLTSTTVTVVKLYPAPPNLTKASRKSVKTCFPRKLPLLWAHGFPLDASITLVSRTGCADCSDNR